MGYACSSNLPGVNPGFFAFNWRAVVEKWAWAHSRQVAGPKRNWSSPDESCADPPGDPGGRREHFQTHKDSVERLCTADYSAEQIAMWLDGRSPQTYREAIVGGNVWLAQNDGIQGFVEVDGHEVSKLFIRGSGARQGIGRLLLEKALQQIRDAGHSRAYLEATLTAEKFYQQFGFRKIGEGTFSRGNSLVSIEIIKMERPLQAT
jgi:GNAT superfamily N-acetyltransferase